MTTACDIYAIPTLTWPKQQFPGDHPTVSRLPQGARLAAKRAWNFFEEVEAIDAAKRVRLGITNGFVNRPPPGTWYEFTSEDQRALYNRGRYYHRLICPEFNWTPQRNLPFPYTPLASVTPAPCPCVGDACEEVDLVRAIAQTVDPPAPATAPAPLSRSAAMIQEGISSTATTAQAYQTIDIVSNTPSTPLSAATPESAGTPTSVGSPAAPGTPASTKEPAPQLEVTEISLQTATPPPEPAQQLEVTEISLQTPESTKEPSPQLEVTEISLQTVTPPSEPA
jgi:hypothetical protein